jgi:hypothetical protein
MAVGDQRAVRRRVLRFALGFPGAYEDHPWDEDVIKVAKKIFVFLGAPRRASRLLSSPAGYPAPGERGAEEGR